MPRQWRRRSRDSTRSHRTSLHLSRTNRPCRCQLTASSRLSSRQNNSLSTTKVGEPKTPSSRARVLPLGKRPGGCRVALRPGDVSFGLPVWNHASCEGAGVSCRRRHGVRRWSSPLRRELRKVVDDADLEEVKTSRLAPHIVERATGTSYLAADKAVSINRSIQPHGMGVAQKQVHPTDPPDPDNRPRWRAERRPRCGSRGLPGHRSDQSSGPSCYRRFGYHSRDPLICSVERRG